MHKALFVLPLIASLGAAPQALANACSGKTGEVGTFTVTAGVRSDGVKPQEVLVFEKGHRALKDPSLPGLLLGPRATKGAYPTAKPVEAYERIILNTTDPGDLVLDPFAGSGNCGIAALKHGRRAILIDVEHSGVYDTFRNAGLLHEMLYLWGRPVDASALDILTYRIGA